MQNSTDAGARRAALLAVKLATLVRESGGVEGVKPHDAKGFGGGAGLVAEGEAWVLIDERPERGLGAALAWALRHGGSSLSILADAGTGHLARRAAGFDFPIRVFHVEGRTLIQAIPEPLPARRDARPEHLALLPLIVQGEAEPVEEHGVVAGEVRGLEVCRVVDDPDTGAVRLEVGIGAHDREAFQLLHGDRPTVEALSDVVRSVGERRAPLAPPHPLNQLAASRLLRSRLVERPGLVGAVAVVPAEPPIARQNVKDEVPSVAMATLPTGRTELVVCTSGIDLDVVPFAVDAASYHGAASCTIAAPARDVVDIQLRLAALCRVPTAIVPIAGEQDESLDE